MTEETVKVKRITCDLCGYEDAIEVKNKFLSKPKTPDTWGYDLHKQDQMCPNCKKKYREGYFEWYSNFKQSRKGKGKSEE